MSVEKKKRILTKQSEKSAKKELEENIEEGKIAELPTQNVTRKFGGYMKQSIKRALQSVRGGKKKTDLMQGAGSALLPFPYNKAGTGICVTAKGTFICKKCTQKLAADICPCDNCRKWKEVVSKLPVDLEKEDIDYPWSFHHQHLQPAVHTPKLPHPDTTDSEASIVSSAPQLHSVSEPVLEKRSISDLINASYDGHEQFEEDTEWNFGIDQITKNAESRCAVKNAKKHLPSKPQ